MNTENEIRDSFLLKPYVLFLSYNLSEQKIWFELAIYFVWLGITNRIRAILVVKHMSAKSLPVLSCFCINCTSISLQTKDIPVNCVPTTHPYLEKLVHNDIATL